MRVLITGAAGFLGHGIVNAMRDHHELVCMDVVPSTEGPVVVGSVVDLEAVRQAMEGCDAVVIAHMAPRSEGVYDTPHLPFEINVTGTANLYMAALEAGVQKTVLISSLGVVWRGGEDRPFARRDAPYRTSCHPYPLTKICQEQIALQYHLNHGMGVGVVRPGYIMDAAIKADKYSRPASVPNGQYIDRTDIGHVARLALELDDLGYEIFYTLGHQDGEQLADVAYTKQRLGWQPVYDFR